MVSLPCQEARFLITEYIQSKGYFPVSGIAKRAEILLLAFNAFSLREITPAQNHFVDCLGRNRMLLLLLHYINWEFQMGVYYSTVSQFFSLIKIVQIVLSSLFNVPYDATFHSPASCSWW